MGETDGRCGSSNRHARPHPASRTRAQVRPTELADQSGNCCHRSPSMKLQPYDFPEAKPNRMKAFFDGDSVPKPLGFSAFSPEWLLSLGRLAPPPHSGTGSAPRAHPFLSLYSPQLRPVTTQIP